MVAAIIVATILRGRNADPFQAAAVVDPPFTSLTYGIHAFLWWDGGEVGMNLDWVRMMRFTHVKQTIAWRDIQPEQDSPFDFSRVDDILSETEARGIELVARLGGVPEWAMRAGASPDAHDTPPTEVAQFGAYCGALAGRFSGRIRAYQIWNEPNLAREWGGFQPDAAGYVDLLAACSDAIRAADPGAILISAGLSPTGNEDATALRDDLYLQAMYDAGFQHSIDVVGAHAAGYDAPEVGPDDAVAKGRHRWMSFRRVEDLRKIMIANGDAARQMALLEVGWTTNPVDPAYAWYAVSDAQQAAYLRDAYAYAAEHWRPWVGLMSAIFLADPSWTEADEEYWFSITQPQEDQGFRFIAARPAFDALLRMEKVCGDIVLPAYPADQAETPLIPENPCR
jgi:polysaccharide biosynthesis protein PslG